MAATVMVMKVGWPIAVVLVSIGCATSYQRKGFSGGYSDTQLGPGRYSVDVQVNSYTSQGTALEYAHRRAGELCPAGYDVVDESKAQSDFYIRTGNTLQNAPKANVALIVECRRPAAIVSGPPGGGSSLPAESIDALRPAPAAATGARVVKVDTRPMYCSVRTDDHAEGACALSASVCNERREQLSMKTGEQYGECAESPGAACFNANGVIDGSRRLFCFPSVKACEANLTDARSNADLTVTAMRCGIYRVQNSAP